MLTIERARARRIAVSAQLLNAPRPTDLLTVVRRLAMVQLDPTAAIAPAADLVLWSRLGAAYRPEQLQQAVERDRTLFEHRAVIRPMEDLGLYLAEMAGPAKYQQSREWLAANESFRTDVLARLTAEGPLLSRDIPDTSTVPWPSTGWSNNRNVTQLLEILVGRGQVAIAGRRGKQRVWDLAERVYPADVPVVPLAEALRIRDERRLRALGIARSATAQSSVEPRSVGAAGDEVTVDGVPGTWRVDPEALDRPFTGRTALLSPFDRLAHDRARALELFEFDYTLEMYKPKPQRQWGYFALPVLHHDRLVGKVDAAADRKAGVLRVAAIHEDVRFTKPMTAAVRKELANLAGWLGLELELG